MYLHVGNNMVVRFPDIVGIFDIENTSVSKTTKQYLYLAEKKGRVVNVSYDIPKSFIVCQGEKGIQVYISPISAATLKRRFQSPIRSLSTGRPAGKKGQKPRTGGNA